MYHRLGDDTLLSEVKEPSIDASHVIDGGVSSVVEQSVGASGRAFGAPNKKARRSST
jgi:hypothetical protein